HAMVASPTGNGNGKIERLTVRQAMERYVDYKHQKGQPVGDLISRSSVHILPTLGDLVVSELTAEQLRRWLHLMAHSPAQRRARGAKPQYRSEPPTDEEHRQRRASANRVLTMLKAALNHAYDEGHVASRDAWGRRLAPFEKVEVARVRYLTVAEAERLINACEPDFRALVRAGLEPGCRYGELVRWLEVCDFNPDASTLAIRQSKTGSPGTWCSPRRARPSSARTRPDARGTNACSPMPTAVPGDRPSRPARWPRPASAPRS